MAREWPAVLTGGMRSGAIRIVAGSALLLLAAAAMAQAQEQGAAPFGVRETSLGVLLTDAEGFTLYSWAGDSPGVSNCHSDCAVVWPPALVAAERDLAPIGTAARPDGSLQLTWNGMPLYRYAGDTRPGDTSGDGTIGYGALWSVVVLDAETLELLGG